MNAAAEGTGQGSAIDWRALQSARRQIVGYAYLADRSEYARLRRMGAGPLEALDALLWLESEWERPAVLGACLPARLGTGHLEALLVRYGIHPLSVATQLQDRRGALRFLRRTGWSDWAPWISRHGNLVLKGSSMFALPAGLILRGMVLISDCPELEDLGEGLKVMAGDLIIKRCPKLRRLPHGLETLDITGVSIEEDGTEKPFEAGLGNVVLLECPLLEAIGARTKVRGAVLALECPAFQGHQ